jgi:hypothetical protein
MDKGTYIRTRLAKLTHKKWELLVISRVLHRLDDLSIEFVCQQAVHYPDGSHDLTDLFFPQFGLHLEVDEKHHGKDKNQEADLLREHDIVATTRDAVHRIRVFERDKYRPVEHIFGDIERFIDLVRERKRAAVAAGTFRPWDLSRRFQWETWTARGSISVEENVSFETQDAALKCFGYTGGRLWKSSWTVKDGSGRKVWFPQIKTQKVWDNRLVETADGTTLTTERLDGLPDRATTGLDMVVFAKETDCYGTTLFRFKGVFVYLADLSTPNRSVYKRIATRTTTVASVDRSSDADDYDVDAKIAGAGMIFGSSPEGQAFKAKLDSGEWTLRR